MHVHACGLHTRDCPWRSSPSCWTRRQGGESRVAYSESSGYWLPIGRSYSCAWYINNDTLGKYSVTVTIMFIWRHDNKNLSLQWGHVSVTKWNNYSCVKLHMKTWVIMISKIMVLTVTYDRSRTRFMTSVRECETGRDGGICYSQFLKFRVFR